MIDNSINVTGGKWLECANNLTVWPQFANTLRSDADVNTDVDKIVDFLILSFPAEVVRKISIALSSEYPSTFGGLK